MTVNMKFIIEMGQLAAEAALRDAGIQYDNVQAVVASYCYGDPTCGEYSTSTCAMHTVLSLVVNFVSSFPL